MNYFVPFSQPSSQVFIHVGEEVRHLLRVEVDPTQTVHFDLRMTQEMIT